MIVGLFITWNGGNAHINEHFKRIKEQDTKRGYELFLWKGALSCHDLFHNCEVFYFNQDYLVNFIKNNRAEYDRLKNIYDECGVLSRKYGLSVSFGWQCINELTRISCRSHLDIPTLVRVRKTAEVDKTEL